MPCIPAGKGEERCKGIRSSELDLVLKYLSICPLQYFKQVMDNHTMVKEVGSSMKRNFKKAKKSRALRLVMNEMSTELQ